MAKTFSFSKEKEINKYEKITNGRGKILLNNKI